MAGFQLFTAITVNFSPMVQRSVHLAFALSLLFLVTPTRAGASRWDSGRPMRGRPCQRAS